MTSPGAPRIAAPLVRPRRRAAWPRAIFGALMVAAGLQLLTHRYGIVLPPLLVPAVAFSAGLALAWSPLEDVIGLDPRRPRFGTVSGGEAWVRFLVGGALVVGSLVWFALWPFTHTAWVRWLVVATVSVAGLALLFAPWWLRLLRQVAVERDERIREYERAEIAAHLHDSVLQTLTLIRAKAEDPEAVARLARAQERDLRAYLYTERRSGAESVATALATAVNEVEDARGVVVELVTVGDAPTDESLAAVVAAAREAVANSAKHGEQPISVYAELTDTAYTVYVRDAGPGFDPKRTPKDRLGIRESIRGRVKRHGGTATITSAPGTRTEVAITMPRRTDA